MKVSRLFMAAALIVSLGGAGFAQNFEFVGAGATFPAPLYLKMFDQYAKEFGVKVNYQAIGSGGGQAQIKGRTVDFGASDVVMTAKDLSDAPAEIVQIPTVAGAVVMASNLPGNPQLRFTGDIIADIFLGKIKNWNDPRIAEINPNVKFPNMNITVVHRSDGSGTTGVFSDYLCKVSNEWKEKVGTGTSLNWPVGIGGKGNPGVAGLVQQLPGLFRVRRADLCPAEQHVVRAAQEQERQLDQGLPGKHEHGGERSGPRGRNKAQHDELGCARGIPHCQLHVAPPLQGAELRQSSEGQGRSPSENDLVDDP